MTKQFILRFTGNKVELHNKLKSWCALAGKPMNGTVIEVIEALVKTNPKKYGTTQNIA